MRGIWPLRFIYRMASDNRFGASPFMGRVHEQGCAVARQISYTLQFGTRFDGGLPLIWSMLADAGLEARGIVVPRPKRYRDLLAARVAAFDGTPASPEELNAMLGLDQLDQQRDLHFVLRITDLMQPPAHFCPAGDWFFEIGPRAAHYRSIFAPAPMTFALSLSNPAVMLSQAWASGEYPGIDVVTPDPFQLHWSVVLRELRESCPEAAIIAWTAEESPMIWDRVLRAVSGTGVDFSNEANIHVAKLLMNEEGSARLADYLASHPNMPDALRARVIGIFLKRFAREDEVETEIVIPGWSDDAQARMDAHYAADLDEVAGIEGVTLIRL